MALSTRVKLIDRLTGATTRKLVVAGGVLAIGVLGAGGAAYASSAGDSGPASFVTTVDDGPAGAPAPATGDRDCPYGDNGGGTGGGTGGGSAAPGSPATPGDA